MVQPTFAALCHRIDAATERSPTMVDEWRAAQARRAVEPSQDLSGQTVDDEVDYCLARAEVEARRADEAIHPAAQLAHRRMAALYEQRAIAAWEMLMVPVAGIEPATFGLQNRCSTS